MPWNVLLLPLLAGWGLLNFSAQFRPAARRYEGQRLLLTSAAVGAALLVPARICTMIGERAAPELARSWSQFAPFEHSGVSFTTLVLSSAIVIPGNACVGPAQVYPRVVETRDDHLERPFLRSIVESASLAFTLKSGKVYVGQVLNMPTDLANERKYVRLPPLLSGYRDATTHQLRFTTDYAKVYPRLDASTSAGQRTTADEFVLVIPVAEISAANPFDWDVYEWFNETAPRASEGDTASFPSS